MPKKKFDKEKKVKIIIRDVDYDGDAVEFLKLWYLQFFIIN